jgi:phage/plasmid-associated DNA primase
MNTIDFIEFCEKNGFIGFTFGGITTSIKKTGAESKDFKGMPNWRNITRENWKNFCNKSHSGYAIITGELSGVSVIDFDTVEGYQEFSEKYLLEKNCFKVKTRKGYHLYCKYNDALRQTQNKVANVDVRNNGGIIIAPPTSYKLLDGTTAEYKIDDDSELLDLTDEMLEWCGKNDLIQNVTDEKSKTTKKKSKPNTKMEDEEEEPKTVKKKTFQILSPEQELRDEIFHYLDNGMFLGISKQTDPYGTWLRLGASLKSECGEYGIHLFKEISKLYPDYWDEKGCEKIYDGIKCDKITIGTLFYYLKQEDEKKFKELKREWKMKKLNLIECDFNTGLIADYFIGIYNNEFLFTNKRLYYWNGIYWKEDDDSFSYMNKFIDKTFVNELTQYYLIKFKEWCDYRNNNDVSKEESGIMDKKLQNFISNVNNKLRNHHFRSSYIKEICNKVSRPNVVFDLNPTLFVFENAVVDLNTGKQVLPNPDDLMKLSCGYNYEAEDTEKVGFLTGLLNKFFPEEEVKNHYLEILATGLCGYPQERFFVATGRGGNGKGVLNDLMMETVGKYGYKLTSEFVMNPIKTGANPEVANMNGKRFVKCEEPPANRRIKCAVIKEITGGKHLNARLCNSNDCEVILKMTFLMECNDMPRYDEVGDAMGRRNDITPFISKAVPEEEFNTTPEEDRKNLYIINPYYKTDSFKNSYKSALFHILLKYFKKFADNHYTLSAQPKSVLIKNKEQMVASDDFFGWFEKTFKPCNDAPAVKMKEVYSIFENSPFFCNLSKNDKRIYNQKYFKEKMENHNMIKKYIVARDKYFNGIKMTGDVLVGHIQRQGDEED